MRIWKALWVVFLIMSTGSSLIASDVIGNKKSLEAAVQSSFNGHYLTSTISLQDKNTWLSIELKGKTWRNPNDTRALVDSVAALVNSHLPLTETSIPFKVYIDEPVSGFPIAEIDATTSNVTLDYQYSQYKEQGKAKVYGSSAKKKPSSEYVTLNFKKAVGYLYSNVKLYYGPNPSKRYIGKIVCFQGDYVAIQYPSGSIELKYRSAIVNYKDRWYVDENDPAIGAGLYYTCD